MAVFAEIVGAQDKRSFLSVQYITYYFPPARIIDYIIGFEMGCLYLDSSLPRKISWLTELIVIIAIFASWMAYPYCELEGIKYVLLWTPTTLGLIWLLSCGGGYVADLFSNRVSVYIGDISAEGFLIHGVALKYTTALLNRILGKGVSNQFFIAAIALAATIAISAICKKLKQFLKYQNSTRNV